MPTATLRRAISKAWRDPGMIIVRTHGGIGNQLFQLLYARLLADALGEGRLRRAHDLRYPLRFEACNDFEVSPVGPGVGAVLSWIRLPKLLLRAGMISGEQVQVGPFRLLDGYFQQIAIYTGFKDTRLQAQLGRIAGELNIGVATRGRLVHLRLGDFFADEASAVAHVEARLDAIHDDCDLISNRDDLFAQPSYASRLNARNVRYLPSADLSPREVLRLMATYRKIESNNSTLAFWGAVLGGGDLAGNDMNQQHLLELFQAAHDPSTIDQTL